MRLYEPLIHHGVYLMDQTNVLVSADLSTDATGRFLLQPECPQQTDRVLGHQSPCCCVLCRYRLEELCEIGIVRKCMTSVCFTIERENHKATYLLCLKRNLINPFNIAMDARLYLHLVYSSRIITLISKHIPRHWTAAPYMNFTCM